LEPRIPSRRIQPGAVSVALVLEAQLNLGAIGADLAVLELEVELGDLRDPQIAQRLRRFRDRSRGGLLPRLGAGPHQLDDLVDALGHGSASSGRLRSTRPDGTPRI